MGIVIKMLLSTSWSFRELWVCPPLTWCHVVALEWMWTHSFLCLTTVIEYSSRSENELSLGCSIKLRAEKGQHLQRNLMLTRQYFIGQMHFACQSSVTVTKHLIQTAYKEESLGSVYDQPNPLLLGQWWGTASWLGCIAKKSCLPHGGREAKRERKRPPFQHPWQGTHQSPFYSPNTSW